MCVRCDLAKRACEGAVIGMRYPGEMSTKNAQRQDSQRAVWLRIVTLHSSALQARCRQAPAQKV